VHKHAVLHLGQHRPKMAVEPVPVSEVDKLPAAEVEAVEAARRCTPPQRMRRT